MRPISQMRALAGLAGLVAAIALITAQTVPSQAQSATPLTVRWVHTKPRAIVLETDDGEPELTDRGSYFAGTIPAARGRRAFWPLIASYGNRQVKLMLEIRQPHPNLAFNLPYPAPAFCHIRYVAEAAAAPTSRESALYQMMMAHHLLQLESPDYCGREDRSTLLAIRWQRNAYLVSHTTYFALVPEYRDQYYADLERQRQVPALRARAVAQLAQVEAVGQQALAISVNRIYEAQSMAQTLGNAVLARDMLSELAELGRTDVRWRQAIQAQRVDVERDLRFLNVVVMDQQQEPIG